jgi:histidyl-tRNA synthetase
MPKIQPPTGTRDLYPLEAAKRRFITEAWRKVSINHGFEEIDGPTFEHLELYTVKSGEGIVSELFSFTRAGGEKDYALRPEFTPTLARMYAERAKSLPKPTKWFTAGPFFRAERPQRGRLREFLQWNCDVIGLPPHDEKDEDQVHSAKAQADGEIVGCVIEFLGAIGLTRKDVVIRFNNREIVDQRLLGADIPAEKHARTLALIDGIRKLSDADVKAKVAAIGITMEQLDRVIEEPASTGGVFIAEHRVDQMLERFADGLPSEDMIEWCRYDPTIVRGLAYYTGMVFEVIVDGERAVAGGGRYDNLIEMFGGPPTPAVGFGMGDVVLSLVLQDKGLMPKDEELLEKAGLRPDVFVIGNGTPEADAQVRPLVAALRRKDLHARHTYKTTKNVGKLLKEASDLRARIAIILESATSAALKDLASGEQVTMELGAAADEAARRLRPAR